jgi:hypothetical protein
MSSYSELITSLKSNRNVKDKRHAIKALAPICANRAYQSRIITAGGWEDAIQPLMTSLDQECRTYASLSVCNLATSPDNHAYLLKAGALRDLVRISNEDEADDLAVFTVTALGNMAASPICWPQFLELGTLLTMIHILQSQKMENLIHACLFTVSNLTPDPAHLERMASTGVIEVAWKYMYEPNKKIFIRKI